MESKMRTTMNVLSKKAAAILGAAAIATTGFAVGGTLAIAPSQAWAADAASATVSGDTVDIDDCDYLDVDFYIETGDGSFPAVKLYKYSGSSRTFLTEGVDYEIEHTWYQRQYNATSGEFENVALSGAPTKPGNYRVKAVGKGNYTGETFITVTVNFANNISSYIFDCETADYVLGSNAAPHAILYKLNGYGPLTNLTLGTDYVVDSKWYVATDEKDADLKTIYKAIDGVPADDDEYYYLKITGIGSYTGTRYCHVYTETAESHQHFNANIPAKAATATEAGNKEYWICYSCGKLFSDANARNETTLSAVTIPATGKTSTTVKGVTYTISGSAVKVTAVKKKAKKVTVVAKVKINGKTYKVSGIKSGTFKGAKAKTVVVKTANLTKKSVKGAFKGAKNVKTVKVKVGKAKANKKAVKKYKKIFTKKACGKKVTVK